MGFLDGLRGLFAGLGSAPQRTTGLPPSGNGASSFHLWWAIPPGQITEIAATLTVVRPPAIDRLYFFAIQAGFRLAGSDRGGAHLGLQWNPRFPDRLAVNWGGYDADGSILAGTASPLPSGPGDPNTRDFAWRPGRPYRLRIGPAVAEAASWLWPGSVADLERGETVVVRSLITTGDELTRPVAWTEAFAACDDPSVEIHWSDLTITTTEQTYAVPRCSTAYQAYEQGGCTNTDSTTVGDAFAQSTAVERTTPAGTVLSL